MTHTIPYKRLVDELPGGRKREDPSRSSTAKAADAAAFEKKKHWPQGL